jgi:hypothetical protein
VELKGCLHSQITAGMPCLGRPRMHLRRCPKVQVPHMFTLEYWLMVQ